MRFLEKIKNLFGYSPKPKQNIYGWELGYRNCPFPNGFLVDKFLVDACNNKRKQRCVAGLAISILVIDQPKALCLLAFDDDHIEIVSMAGIFNHYGSV